MGDSDSSSRQFYIRTCEHNCRSPLLASRCESSSFLRYFGIRCAPISRNQGVTLFLLSLATLSASLGISLFPPFYPQVAERKGASASLYGFILGSNCLTTFLVTPIIGKNLKTVGPKFAFVAGMFSNGVCCVCAGFLDQMKPGATFITFSVAIRILHAIGNAGVITASFTFIAVEFNECIATIFSLTRLMMNIGQLIGPALGGMFFEIGGYALPFVLLGIFQILVAFLCACILGNYQELEAASRGEKNLSITAMLKLPGMWVAFGAFLVSTLANGFISVTLEPQVLRQFGLEAFYMGLLYGVKDGANSVFSLIWGWLCDSAWLVKPCLVISCLTVCVSLIILGPFPGLDFERSLWLTSFALVLLGIGVGGQQLGGVIDALQEAVDAGYPNDPTTQGCVAGMWSSIGGLGRFVARSGCGVMVDHVGFQWSSVVITMFHAVLALFTLIYMSFKRPVIPIPREMRRPLIIPSAISQVQHIDSKVLQNSSELHRSRTLSLLA